MSEFQEFRQYEQRMREAADVVTAEVIEDLRRYFAPVLGDFGFRYESGFRGGYEIILCFENDQPGETIAIHYHTQMEEFWATHYFLEEYSEEGTEEGMSQAFRFESFMLMLSQWLKKIGIARVVGNGG